MSRRRGHDDGRGGHDYDSDTGYNVHASSKPCVIQNTHCALISMVGCLGIAFCLASLSFLLVFGRVAESHADPAQKTNETFELELLRSQR